MSELTYRRAKGYVDALVGAVTAAGRALLDDASASAQRTTLGLGVMPLALPQWVVASADQTAIGTSFADVTSLSFSVAANKTYYFRFDMIADSDATTTGIDVAVNGPASPTSINYTQRPWNSASAIRAQPASAYDNNTAQANSAGATRAIYAVEGVLVNGANAGALAARIKREAVGSGPNVRAGSFGVLVLLN